MHRSDPVFGPACIFAALLLCLLPAIARATVFSQLMGVVHDPQHRPLPAAHVTLAAVQSAFVQSADTDSEGAFTFTGIPLGDYTVSITHPGFATLRQSFTVLSGTSPMLHFQLQLGPVAQNVTVTAPLQTAAVDTVTPTSLISRLDIAQTPGADRTNSLAIITDYVPGAYITHDMLHMRGGHQLNWQIDGVEIPNTNVASNLGPQIDPKDIDYLEVQRGSYTSDVGDRTYGVFNIVPRNGFERDRQAELVLSAGNFLQANAQLSLGNHTEKFAWYFSTNGNRSDYGLAPPIGQVFHDAENGYGGFASLLYNRSPRDQLRLISLARADYFQIPYDPNSADFENQQYDSSHLRDGQHETDSAEAFTWLHTFNPSTALQVSPFYHFNQVDYASNPSDIPVATTYNRASTYAGAQSSINTVFAHNTLQAGLYSFAQHDTGLLGAIFNDASANNFSNPGSASGGVVEEYVSDTFNATSWLTLIAGLRQTQFRASFAEDETDPRFGAALRIPKLDWVFRAFYGRFYQPPPLLTVSGPVLQYAQANNTAFAPLHGERDEEHQFGVQIPFHAWLLDADTFKTRANNFLDHASLGESSLYFPVTIDGALIRAWETALRSPHIDHLGQFHLAYSNQVAQQRGAITGGLICAPANSPTCAVPFTYIPLDHDQRNTLNLGFNATLPRGVTASTNVYYGSGFTNGSPNPATPYPNPYLPQHTTFDLAVGKSFGENLSASITATNAANRRLLLDNSLTFGGFHFNDPRELYAELRYRFHF